MLGREFSRIWNLWQYLTIYRCYRYKYLRSNMIIYLILSVTQILLLDFLWKYKLVTDQSPISLSKMVLLVLKGNWEILRKSYWFVGDLILKAEKNRKDETHVSIQISSKGSYSIKIYWYFFSIFSLVKKICSHLRKNLQQFRNCCFIK